MPLDKVPAETVRPTAKETTRTEKAEAQVAEVKQVIEDGKPVFDYPEGTKLPAKRKQRKSPVRRDRDGKVPALVE